MANTKSLICKNCGERTLHINKGVNHVLHLILSIITGGIWLIVWLIISMDSKGEWQCSKCGKAATGSGWGALGAVARGLEQSALESNPKYTNKKCPFCAETIKAEAIVCRYCGKDLSPKENESALQTEEIKQERLVDEHLLVLERVGFRLAKKEKLWEISLSPLEKDATLEVTSEELPKLSECVLFFQKEMDAKQMFYDVLKPFVSGTKTKKLTTLR